jgi:DHA1 family bicyclomycin/chloramphenicol resistance-like MFS transporter
MKNPHSLVFLIFLAGLAALPPFSIDMALPALRDISASLHTEPGLTGLTLTLFMAGFAATPVVYGPLSDRFGRRPILFVAITLFTLGSLAAAAAPSIALLLAARFLEGAGAGGGTAMAFAIVRDSYEGHEGRVKLSNVQMVMGVAPMIAPTLGAFVLLAGWRSIYATLGLGGIALLATVLFSFKESHTERAQQGSVFGGVIKGYALLLRRRAGLGYALLFGASFGVQFSFISGSPLVFMGHFGLSPRIYGLIFGFVSAGIIAGAFGNGRFTRIGISQAAALKIGLSLYLLTGFAMLALLVTGQTDAMNLTVLLVISALAFGLIAPNASHGTMQALPEIGGLAGAVLTTLQMSVAVLSSAIVAASFAYFGLAAMIVPMLCFGLITNALYYFMVVPALKTA